MMKKHSVLVLGLLAAVVGCSDGDGGGAIHSSGGHAGALVATGGKGGTGGTGGATPAGAGTAGLGGTAGAAGAATGGTAEAAGAATGGTAGTAGEATGGTSGAAVAAGTAGISGATEVAGTGGTGGSSGTVGGGGSGGSCTVPSLVVFTRSDTNQTWDDNDFDSVTLGADACPKQVSVTWPHETGWENADPADANHEVVHFTLDSDSSVDLSNKKLSLTIELASDTRGPSATAAAYSVSLVSVSTYDRVVSSGGAGTDAGGASGSGGASGGASGGLGGTGGGAGSVESGGVSGGGLGGADSSGGSGGATVVTEIAYSEAESAVADRATLRFAGDRATVTFPLPNKTSTVSSYDPKRVIKINVRIYTTFSNGQSSGAGGTSGAGGASGGAGGAPVYDYVSSVFSITNFVIKDANAP